MTSPATETKREPTPAPEAVKLASVTMPVVPAEALADARRHEEAKA